MKGRRESGKTRSRIVNGGWKLEHQMMGRESQGFYFLSTAEVRVHIPSTTPSVLMAGNSTYIETSRFPGFCLWSLEKMWVPSFVLLLESFLALFFRALSQHGSLLLLNHSLHWADCWDNLQQELSELRWPGYICVQPCFAFSSICFWCKPRRAGSSYYTHTHTHTQNLFLGIQYLLLSAILSAALTFLKCSALLWDDALHTLLTG